jgi:hypothetical protein
MTKRTKIIATYTPPKKPKKPKQMWYRISGNPWCVYAKEEAFFIEQGGLRESWGKDWRRVRASSIEEARVKGKKMLDDGIKTLPTVVKKPKPQSAAQRAAGYLESKIGDIAGISMQDLAKDLRREDRQRREMEREIHAWWLSFKPIGWDAKIFATHPTCNIHETDEKLARIAARIEKEQK